MGLLIGLVASVVLASVVGLVWGFLLAWPAIPAIVAYFVAIGVGFAAAMGVVVGATNRGAICTGAALLATVIGLAVGEFTAFQLRIPDIATEFAEDEMMIEVAATYDVLRGAGAGHSMEVVTKGGGIGFSYDDEQLGSMSVEEFDAAVETRTLEFQQAQKVTVQSVLVDLLKSRLSPVQKVSLSLDVMSYIFGAIALFTAWKVARPEHDDSADW